MARPPFTWPLRVYWEDTDAGGIVFYANHLKFFERARTEWLRSLGVQQQALREQTGGLFVVTDTQLRFLRPARLDDQLLVSAELRRAGRASAELWQQSFRVTEGDGAGRELLCEGTIRIGWVRADTLAAARMPAPLWGTLAACLPSDPAP